MAIIQTLPGLASKVSEETLQYIQRLLAYQAEPVETLVNPACFYNVKLTYLPLV